MEPNDAHETKHPNHISDFEFYWDWVKHEDNLFTTRSNFFMVAESILFAGVKLGPNTAGAFSVFILYLFGVVVSSIWIWTCYIQGKGTVSNIKKHLRDIEPRYANICNDRQIYAPVHKLMGFVLPLCFMGVWIVLSLLMLTYSQG
jgi:hypothetical protein